MLGRGASLVSMAESLDAGTAAGRLMLNIMTAVSQWERAANERTLDAMSHKRATASDVLDRILELKAAGRATREIADELEPAGLYDPERDGLALPVRARGPQGRRVKIAGMQKKSSQTKPKPVK